MDEAIRLGSDRSFVLELSPTGGKVQQAGLAWSKARLWISDELVWCGDNNTPLEWTWLDVLEWLSENWAWLLCEQALPFNVKSQSLATLMRDLERRWENMSEELVEDEEEEALRFLARHDMSHALKGIFLPAVLLFRQGNIVNVQVPSQQLDLCLPLEDVAKDLESIGNGLFELASNKNPRAKAAMERWQQRNNMLRRYAIPLLSGMSVHVHDKKASAEDWEYDPSQPLQESELLAAARMTRGSLTDVQQQQLLHAIRQIPKQTTPILDSLCSKLAHEFKEVSKPHDQGYWAANWLRKNININRTIPVNPRSLLTHWNIKLCDLYLDNSRLDAIACWGRLHGPVIYLNRAKSSAAGHIYGERSTLAHEICHLLLDRKGALPVAEVLNGHTPERLEKRARAFAAELLLPRETTAAMVAESSTLNEAIDYLRMQFQVSEELICWQIINSPAHSTLSEEELQRLERVVEP